MKFHMKFITELHMKSSTERHFQRFQLIKYVYNLIRLQIILVRWKFKNIAPYPNL